MSKQLLANLAQILSVRSITFFTAIQGIMSLLISRAMQMPRPIQYDRERVLEQAMEVFWDQGYCATGVAEIGAITRLKPGSLYGAFESKEKLFMEALDQYGKKVWRGYEILCAMLPRLWLRSVHSSIPWPSRLPA